MKSRFIIYVIAGLLAFGVAMLTRYLTRVSIEQEYTNVMVARKNLPVGYIVVAEDLIWQRWPNSNLNSVFITRENQIEAEKIPGSIVRYPVVMGEPIIPSKFVRSKDKSLLSAIITPGKRAFALQMGKRSNLTSLIAPGDLVDIVIVNKNNSPNNQAMTAQTIIRKAPVIATDGLLVRDQIVKNTEPPEEVTIEITPSQAEHLTAALTDNKPTLTVYSLANMPASEQETAPSPFVMPVQNEAKAPPVSLPQIIMPKVAHNVTLLRGNQRTDVNVPEEAPPTSSNNNGTENVKQVQPH